MTGSKDLKSAKILIIDDEPDLAEIFVEILRDENFDVSFVENWKDLKSETELNQYALVLGDVHTAGPDAFTYLKKLQNPPSCKITLVSGALSDSEMAIFEQMKAQYNLELLLKPFTNQQLINYVAQRTAPVQKAC